MALRLAESSDVNLCQLGWGRLIGPTGKIWSPNTKPPPNHIVEFEDIEASGQLRGWEEMGSSTR
ncbi:hypothetical protein PHLCEN_2v11554 [Hermanssonia centrifuga]|uniref:Uncharacterized protein n=1 Tax=Hermanssonia centrifuga TaxID=98765 RepID=A0A2R6NJS7_9APHY|nr:hypothetical protein PHLCEN_2v11554 [Hermanssonia centrifuga]